MHGGISILLLRGGGGMDINIYFDTTSLYFIIIPFLFVPDIHSACIRLLS